MKAYCAAHWRGDHSLARSYWINNGLIGAGLYLLVVFSLTSALIAPVLILLAIPATLALLAQVVWAVVGTCRSARRTGGFWGLVVEGLIVLGLLLGGASVIGTMGSLVAA